MMKLTVLSLVILMVLCANAQWEDEEHWDVPLGSLCGVQNCQKEKGASCSKSKFCCCPNVCWVHGECHEKVPESVSQEGLVVVTGQVGEWAQYDTCENNLGRVGDSCETFQDCCIPLNCENNICTAGEGVIANIGKLMSGGG